MKSKKDPITRMVFLSNLTPEQIGRLAWAYKQSIETGDDYLNVDHENPAISKKIDEASPLTWSIIMYWDRPHLLVEPEFSGGSVPPIKRNEVELELIPFILPLNGTMVEVSEQAYNYIIYNLEYEP